MTADIVLGIDFGTTNSACAVRIGGELEILENAEKDRLTPSVVYFTKGHERNQPLVGAPADNKARENPERVVRSIKRQLGDREYIDIAEEDHKVQEVASEILRKIRTDAAKELDINRVNLTDAVITTPAYWESDRTKAVHEAAKLAGFESIRLIKEPAAAAIAYGRNQANVDKTLGVYDLGGGTFDFALVDVDVTGESQSDTSTPYGDEEYDVIAQSGDPELGGDDWDEVIVDWLVEQFESQTGVNPLEPHRMDESGFEHRIREERLRSQAQTAKERLSHPATQEVEISVPFLIDLGNGSEGIEVTLTETHFQSMTDDLLQRTVDPIYTALDDAGLAAQDVDEVILVGGSTHMPQVRELVHSVFEQKPQRHVGPEEAVALGAAVKGNRDDILLLEVTPLSLGIGIKGDRFKRMIDRNARLPAKTTEVFTTSGEGDSAVRIPIYQGERDIASENRRLKTLLITGMEPGSRHTAHIEVTFEVRKNGLINVRAVENTRDRSVEVEIEGENSLSEEFIQSHVEEAQRMEEMDHRREMVIKAQNEAEDAVRSAERQLTEFSHKIDPEERDEIEKHIVNVRRVRSDKSSTLGELRDATNDLNEWVLEIGDRVRRSNAQPKPTPKEGPDLTNNPSSGRNASDEGGAKSGGGSTVTTDDSLSEGWAQTNPDSATYAEQSNTPVTPAASSGGSAGNDGESVDPTERSPNTTVSEEDLEGLDIGGAEEALSSSSDDPDPYDPSVFPDTADDQPTDDSKSTEAESAGETTLSTTESDKQAGTDGEENNEDISEGSRGDFASTEAEQEEKEESTQGNEDKSDSESSQSSPEGQVSDDDVTIRTLEEFKDLGGSEKNSDSVDGQEDSRATDSAKQNNTEPTDEKVGPEDRFGESQEVSDGLGTTDGLQAEPEREQELNDTTNQSSEGESPPYEVSEASDQTVETAVNDNFPLPPEEMQEIQENMVANDSHTMDSNPDESSIHDEHAGSNSSSSGKPTDPARNKEALKSGSENYQEEEEENLDVSENAVQPTDIENQDLPRNSESEDEESEAENDDETQSGRWFGRLF